MGFFLEEDGVVATGVGGDGGLSLEDSLRKWKWPNDSHGLNLLAKPVLKLFVRTERQSVTTAVTRNKKV